MGNERFSPGGEDRLRGYLAVPVIWGNERALAPRIRCRAVYLWTEKRVQKESGLEEEHYGSERDRATRSKEESNPLEAPIVTRKRGGLIERSHLEREERFV